MRLLDLLLIAALATMAAPSFTPRNAPGEQPLLLVACAPGYPGSPLQAQPTMDRFAELVAEAAGLPVAGLRAEYRDSEAGGVERIRAAGDLVIVPLSFFLKYRETLDLRPIVQAVPLSGEGKERWNLVARRGRIQQPADLEGWEITGIPAYAPAFVRGPLLGGWGPLPATVELTFSGRVLGALRRAAAGEDVAVLLDGEQSAALPELPFADELEVIVTSAPLVAALVAVVGESLDESTSTRLSQGLLRVHEAERFHELLTTLRLRRFTALDEEALERAQSSYRAAR